MLVRIQNKAIKMAKSVLSCLGLMLAATGICRAEAIGILEIAPPISDISTLVADGDRRGVHAFAVSLDVSMSTTSHGSWSVAADGQSLWQLHLHSSGATSLSLHFGDFSLPEGAKLSIHDADDKQALGPWTASQNQISTELWTPLLDGDDLVLRLILPAAQVGQEKLRISSVKYGFRSAQPGKATGACHVDVACSPEGDAWRDQIRSVGLLSVGGVQSCSGSLLNTTARDSSPVFLTAQHCYEGAPLGGLYPVNSSVVYWNHEASSCGGPPPPTRDNSMSTVGATLLARWPRTSLLAPSGTDFALIRLASAPPSGSNVYFSGWDRGLLTPASGISIHHPAGEEKKISFENNGLQLTDDSQSSTNTSGHYVRIPNWDVGSTEPGSSGSPLYTAAKLVIGQLSHGNAQCGGAATNSNTGSDWYGRIAISWDGDGTSSGRLRDYLDPEGCGVTSMVGMNPGNAGSLCPSGGGTTGGTTGGGTTGGTTGGAAPSGGGGGGVMNGWHLIGLASLLLLLVRRRAHV